MPNSLNQNDSLSVYINANQLILNVFGGVSGSDKVSLLPTGYTPNTFNNISITLLMDALGNNVWYFVQADDILYTNNIAYGSNYVIEGISKDSLIYVNPVLTTLNIDINRDSMNFYNTANYIATPKQVNCPTSNCNQCLIDNGGFEGCMTCAAGFNDLVTPGQCLTSTNLV